MRLDGLPVSRRDGEEIALGDEVAHRINESADLVSVREEDMFAKQSTAFASFGACSSVVPVRGEEKFVENNPKIPECP